ncbi:MULTISPECIES: energy transducer TonB [unclassified Pseudomonas]|uniref:energy transducer TonB n=1 Tax=unclassified Pseudomonas TaxID=196821 RepID=UPI0035C1C24F
MSDTLPIGLTYLSPVGNYGRQNTQALGGVSHLWQDFFARAMAEQQDDGVDSVSQALASYHDKESGEPTGGARALALIDAQRTCVVNDTKITPPEPLFLPKAELERDLLEPAAEPFSAMELLEQQRQLDLNNSWLRPVVMSQGHPHPAPGPAPTPRSLYLPIAEFETDLLDKAPEPFDEATLAKQQNDLEFDMHWARPVVLNNVRVHA